MRDWACVSTGSRGTLPAPMMSHERARDANPPVMGGPRWIGPLEVLRYLRDPRMALERAVRTFGDPFSLRFAGGPVVLTGHPEAVKAIYSADPEVFAVPMRSTFGPFFGSNSLMMKSGARHRQDRKLLAPVFHASHLRGYGRIIAECVREVVARWVRGRPLVMLDETQAITLQVILRVIFGVEHGPRRQRFHAAFVELMAAMGSPAIGFFEFTRREFGGIGPWARWQRAHARFDALVGEELAERRASGAAAEREDLLSLMMRARYDDGGAMTDDELRDQLQLFLFGGHDTTSISLAWAFYWLHRDAELRSRVLAEIDGLGPDPDLDALSELPLLDAVCHETLRINPVSPTTARLLQRPLELMGHVVPAGTTVLTSIILLHAREELYPEPRRFEPERFLRRKFSPFEFIPFGGGGRRCLGAALALYEMKVVLAEVLRSHRLRLVRDEPERDVLRGLTVSPERGVPMIVDGRR